MIEYITKREQSVMPICDDLRSLSIYLKKNTAHTYRMTGGHWYILLLTKTEYSQYIWDDLRSFDIDI